MLSVELPPHPRPLSPVGGEGGLWWAGRDYDCEEQVAGMPPQSLQGRYAEGSSRQSPGSVQQRGRFGRNAGDPHRIQRR